jgi:muramoyltetrapeptide carboxypeptidase
MRARVIPRRVTPGDAVAIVAPSAPGVAWWPHRLERGCRYLESLGLEPRLMPRAGGARGRVSACGRDRAADIHEAFADPSVGVVLAALGGDHSHQVLPHLDFELIGRNPKVFQGYSDVTVLHWALLKMAGLSTFYGPALLTQCAEFPAVLAYTDRHLRQAWFGEAPIRFDAADRWTDERLDFHTKADLTRARRLRGTEGWVTIRRGSCTGPLVVGCLETLCSHLTGSAWWLDLRGAVLGIEMSDAHPSAAAADSHLTTLGLLGVYEEVAGLLVGRPPRRSRNEVRLMWELLRDHTASSGLPVLANLDFGHTDPMMTLPMGVDVHLDAGRHVLELTGPATAAPSAGGS